VATAKKKEKKKTETPPCRLFVLMAREAPIAVILRRGPTGWYHVIKWHTDTDRFEHGAWFRGRIYEERGDLSPDGELLVYFALQGSRYGTAYAGTWTAVSRVPWLHALALWPQGDTWGGGGRFLTNRKVVLMGWGEGRAKRHPDHPGWGLEVAGRPATAKERRLREPAGAEWTGRDQAKNPVRAARGKLYRTRGGQEVEIADFNDLSPNPEPPPAWAKVQLAPPPPPAKKRRR
jgi:hypothetical protein